MFEKIAGIIAGQLNIDVEKITLDSRLGEDLKADSLDIVSMVMEIEQLFSIEVPDEELMNVKTVRDVVSYIEKTVK